MKKFLSVFLVVFLCSPPAVKSESYSNIAQKITKSSVVIRVKVQEKQIAKNEEEKQSKPREGWFLCSGTQINDGIISNAHCYPAEEYNILQVWVRGNDNKSHKAWLRKIDREHDLLLLDFDGKHYTEASLASRPLQVGDMVFAIGHGLGLENTFSMGVVSFIDRILQGSKIKFIQTTLPINGGFSGSALYNDLGEMVGINNAVITPDWFFHSWSGISLAVPLSQIREFLKK